MQFIPVMTKLNFQPLLFQSSVSYDPSEIILICSFGALIIIIVLLLSMLCYLILWKITAIIWNRNLKKAESINFFQEL